MGSKYVFVLYTQIAMLTMDILFNSLSILLYGNNTVLLLLYILQDTLQVMSALVLLVSFSATFVFQIGLIPLIFTTFLPTIIITIIYILMSIGYHYTSLNASWEKSTINIYDNYLILSFYIIHKLVACFYYSLYKRAALHISDPKYNMDSEWLRLKFKDYFNLDSDPTLAARIASATVVEEVVHHD